MIRRPIPPGWRVGLGVGVAAAVAALYLLLSWRVHAENPRDTTVPTLSQLAAGVGEIFVPEDGETLADLPVWEDIRATGRRFLLGLGIGVGLSFLAGVAMGTLTPVGAGCGPTLLFFGAVPPTAMLAVYYQVFGIGESLFLALIALGVFPLLAGGLYKSVLADVPDHAVSKAYTLGASHAEVVWNVIVPQTLPRFLESTRLAAGLGLIFLIAGEWGFADVGFGYQLKLWSRIAAMDLAYPYLFLLGLFGLAVDRGLLWLRRWACPWWSE